ncbi:MAG: EamA family transporter [Elusimicrobia bacterium]|nr:EamA family transporter [Elusimicrobiota bacterium]
MNSRATRPRGPLLAILSAALFGASPALSKLLIGEMSPVLVAGLLYLGSFLGLQAWSLVARQESFGALRRLKRPDVLRLIASIAAGGVVAPILLLYGIKLAPASEVSLLLSLETVATTILAWIVFREHVGGRIIVGEALILTGGWVLASQSAQFGSTSWAGLLVAGACILWALDNNLTRDIEAVPAPVLAQVKGLVSGTINLLIACFLGLGIFTARQVAGAMAVGAGSYGLSLTLFIVSLRSIGAARTGAYFAAAPFFGALLSIPLLRETLSAQQWVAAAIMLVGVGSLYGETHAHEHSHEAVSHEHIHTHDLHHSHGHGPKIATAHAHMHSHEALTHAHAHWPDLHHRH